MKLVEVFSNTITNAEILDIIAFCDQNSSDDNYKFDHTSFGQKPNNWYSLMFDDSKFVQGRGGLVLAYEDGELIGMSGYYRSSIDPKIYIGAVRTLIHKQYRHYLLTTKAFIPYQISEIQQLGGACVLWLFETEKEKGFYRVVKKQSVKQRLDNDKRNYNSEILRYTEILDYPILVNGKPLNAFVRTIDPDFKFDWSTLKVVGF